MNMKKLVSLVLALVMVMAMSAVAFAADTYSITINNATTGYEYVAYQVFAGDLSGNTLSNVVWGSGVNGKTLLAALKNLTVDEEQPFKDCTSAADVADVLAKNTTFDNAIAQAFAEVAEDNKAGSGATATYADGKYTVSGLEAGYYLVLNTKVPDATEEATAGSYTRFMLEVVKNAKANHKGTVPSVEKKIVEGENKVDENEASIGDTITYEITGTLPSNITEYDTYYYVFTDTLSKGLTYTNNLVVKVNNVDVTKYFYVNATAYDATNGTTITVGIQDLLALENVESVGEINASTKIVVTYTAELNENAVVGTTGNENKVDLEFSNDPNNDGEGTTTPPPENPDEPEPTTPTGKTPEDEVYTYTTDLIIQKTDENGNKLEGAAFKITGDGVNIVVTTGDVYVEDEKGTYWKLKDGTYTTDDPNAEGMDTTKYESTTVKYKLETKVTIDTQGATKVDAEAFVDENGQIVFTGLGAGTYTITEIVTPEGYNSVEPITVTISWDANGTNCTWTYTGTDYTEDEEGNKIYINKVTIVNKSGATLPETGGMGTTMMYIGGGLLVAFAVIMLVTKRRMGTAE